MDLSQVPTEQLLQMLQQHAAPEPPSGMDESIGRAKAVGSGLAESAIGGTIGAVGDLGQLAGKAREGLSNVLEKFEPGPYISPTVQKAMDVFRKVTNPVAAIAESGALPTTSEITKGLGIDYEPQNKTEERFKGVAGGVGAMAAPIGRMSTAGRALLGLLMGGAGQAGKEVAGAPGQLAGSIGSVLIPSLLQMHTPGIVRAVKGAIGELTGGEVAAARAAADKGGAALGTPLLLSQGFDKPNPLLGITQRVAESPEGEAIRRVLAAQPEAGVARAQGLVSGTSPLPVGDQTANLIQDAGQKARQAPNEARAAAVDPLYGQAAGDTMTPGQVSELGEAIRAAREAKQLDPLSPAGRAMDITARKVERAAERATTKSPILDERGQPFTSEEPIPVLQVESLARGPKADLRALQSKAPSSASVKPGSEVGLAATGVEMNQATGAASPALEQARLTGKAFHEGPIAEMERSPMASLFSDKPGTKGDYGTMGRIFDSTIHGPEDVAQVGEQLRSVSPEAFPALVKQHFQAALTKSLEGREGHLDPSVLNNFPIEIAGRPEDVAKRASFVETMKQVALSNGKDPEAVAKGAVNIVDAMTMAARGRGSPSAADMAEFRRQAGSTMTGIASRVVNFLAPFRELGSVLDRATAKKTYGKFVDALTSPEGAKMLQEIANFDPGSERLKTLVQAAMGVKGQSDVGNVGR